MDHVSVNFDYAKYLGLGYKETMSEKPFASQISNHVGLLDVCVLVL